MNHRTHQTSTAQQKISNFLYPDPTLESGQLPKPLLEFCRNSIEGSKGNLLYTEPSFFSVPAFTEFDGGEGSTLELNGFNAQQVIPLKPLNSSRPVIAIDTSTIKLGEFTDGSLCALRGSVVILQDGRYSYVRYGPLVFSLGGNSLVDLQSFANIGLTPLHGELNVDGLLKRVRNFLERWLQFNVAKSVRNALVLIDGSLTAGTPDNPSKELERTLQSARSAHSIVVAISKKTKLRIRNQSITNLLERKSEPCLLDVDAEITDQFPPYPVRFLGRVFVGKLARNGYPFRIDVDREILPEDAVTGIRQLLGSDIVDQGYPETLRIAHILATFTATDVLAIQAFAAASFGIQLIPKLALRRSLFGPFGTASEAWH